MQKQSWLLFFCLILLITEKSFATFEWIVIERGTYQGSGFASNKWDAIDRCTADMESKFIALAQRCCQSTETTTSARFGNRCAGGYNGDQNPRSFFGGVAAYFCWPSGTYEQMPTGYWLARSETREYTCSELMDMNAPMPLPAPTPIPVPSPTPAPTTPTTTYPTTPMPSPVITAMP